MIERLEANVGTPTCQLLKPEIEQLKQLTFAGNEVSCDMHNVVSRIFVLHLSWQQHLEALLQPCGVDFSSDHDCAMAIKQHIDELNTSLQLTKQKLDEWDLRFEAANVQHKISLDVALNDLQRRMDEAHKAEMQKVLNEAEARLSSAIGEASGSQQSRIASLQDELVELQHKNDTMTKTLHEREDAVKRLKAEMKCLRESLEMQKQHEEEFLEKLEEAERNQQVATRHHETELKAAKNSHVAEIGERDEQISQHLATIHALEDRLNKTTNKNKDYQTEIATLKATNAELNERLLQPPPPAKPKMIIQRPVVDVATLEQKIAEFEQQKQDYVKQLQQQNDVIASLRRDLAATMARLSDLTGELNETQKCELEKCKQKLRYQENEISELRQQLSSLSQTSDEQKTRIKSLMAEARNNDQLKEKLSDMTIKLQEVQKELTESRQDKHDCKATDEENTKAELVSIGAQCKGNRHEQVIARQREALVELRVKIRNLEKKCSNAITTPDKALQQVLLLQAQYGILEDSETATTAAAGSDSSATDQAINVARGLKTRTNIDAQIGVLRDTQFALDLSESTYLALLHAMATTLGVEDVPGQRSMVLTPTDGRDKLVEDRTTGCKLLASCIKTLKEQIESKDGVLKAFEQDIAKLSDAQKFAEQSSMKAEDLNIEVRRLTDEVQCLREALTRARATLEKEKRLNTAIKQKKTFHLENELMHRNGWPCHHCIPDNPFDKVQLKKKAQQRQSSIQRRTIEDVNSDLKSVNHTDTQIQHTAMSADA
jgi:chromosome segregation ATPase